MGGFLKHPFRASLRLAWLGFELIRLAVEFLIRVPFGSRGHSAEVRARWLLGGSRRVLRIFDVAIQVTGPIPKHGLLVSNHLSYLDVLVISALTPSVFVAKPEVRNWPVFGWFARLAGTLFADRDRRIQVGPLTTALEAALNQETLVVLFPEGTSSDGREVLPFKSALLEPATKPRHPLAAGHIYYELDDGDVAEEVCYWKDMTFVPHLLNLLSKKRIRALVHFAEVSDRSADRKELARELRGAVLRLKHPEPKTPHELIDAVAAQKKPLSSSEEGWGSSFLPIWCSRLTKKPLFPKKGLLPADAHTTFSGRLPGHPAPAPLKTLTSSVGYSAEVGGNHRLAP
jgi:1-acyl-sn-glycerol-3-phosphate acyltransferase